MRQKEERITEPKLKINMAIKRNSKTRKDRKLEHSSKIMRIFMIMMPSSSTVKNLENLKLVKISILTSKFQCNNQ